MHRRSIHITLGRHVTCLEGYRQRNNELMQCKAFTGLGLGYQVGTGTCQVMIWQILYVRVWQSTVRLLVVSVTSHRRHLTANINISTPPRSGLRWFGPGYAVLLAESNNVLSPLQL